MSENDSDFRIAIDLVRQSGFKKDVASEIVLALYEHRRVMDSYRELYIDSDTSDLTMPSKVKEVGEFEGIEKMPVLKEYLRKAEDEEDEIWILSLALKADLSKRRSAEKVKRLRRMGRYQRRAAAQLSKAIRNN